jgi:molecular chaperone GrpE
MTEKPQSAEAGPAAQDPAVTPGEVDGQAAERVVVRDRRKVDPPGGKRRAPEPDQPAESDTAGRATTDVADGGTPDATESVAAPLGAELQALRGELDERTRDLQRVTAEYANYRKRVDRDRGVAAEQTTGAVLTALLPILDDLDRAREHGDLVGPFAAVADQLTAALSKFGLTAFGEKGDPFDPTRHEAVAHLTSAEVTEPTCIDVMRRGYLLGERLLRPAMVAVADPE